MFLVLLSFVLDKHAELIIANLLETEKIKLKELDIEQFNKMYENVANGRREDKSKL